jgi:hypothetical protein
MLSDPILVMWFGISAGFFFVGIFALAIWFQVHGVRGLALATLALCLGLLSSLLGIVRAGEAARIPPEITMIGIRCVFPAMFLSMAVIVDIWAADHNDHRSVTTITYQWFKRLTRERSSRREQRKTVKESMG